MPPKIHGHRGARGHHPENTLPAIHHALQHADGVELDLCITQDNIVIVHHDLHLNPATTRDTAGNWLPTQPRIPIRSLTLHQLRQYDVGRLNPTHPYANNFPHQQPQDNTPIPTLQQCIQALHQHPTATLNLELKTAPNPTLQPTHQHYVRLVLQTIQQSSFPPARILFQSFDWQLIHHLKQTNPTLTTALTISPSPGQSIPFPKIKQLAVNILSCNHTHLTKPIIQQAHQAGLKVCAWTANTKPTIQNLITNHVDIITTDYPELCRKVLSEMHKT